VTRFKERKMVKVTDKAKKHLKDILCKKSRDPEACLRLISKDDGKLKLSVDMERPGDSIVKDEETNILAFAESIAERLEKKTIDVKVTEKGTRIVVLSARAK
jgi:Fe-S cluster assembly iron-binding protein IscA